MEDNQTLTIINKRGKEIPVIDSREVAEMMGKTHSEIIQYLEGLNYKDGRVKITGIIPTLEQSGDLQVANYFLERMYKKQYSLFNNNHPNYLLLLFYIQT